MSLKDQTKSNMEGVITHFSKELANLRTGRASPSMLDGVDVEVYGANMRIRDLANVTTPEPRQLLITPFDPQTAGAIAKGIEKANLGIQPIKEEGIVRINVPPMDEAQRRDTVKFAKEKAEKAKVSIREARRKGNEQIDADSDLTEDGKRGEKKKVQDLTDQYCKQIDEMFSQREKEIMTV